MSWQIGIHGIRIAFEVKGSTKTATYLPEVAAEQGTCSQHSVLDCFLWPGSRTWFVLPIILPKCFPYCLCVLCESTHTQNLCSCLLRTTFFHCQLLLSCCTNVTLLPIRIFTVLNVSYGNRVLLDVMFAHMCGRACMHACVHEFACRVTQVGIRWRQLRICSRKVATTSVSHRTTVVLFASPATVLRRCA